MSRRFTTTPATAALVSILALYTSQHFTESYTLRTVKVVQGVLRETRYSISGTDHIEQTSEQDFSHDEQTLMNDSIGLHKVRAQV